MSKIICKKETKTALIIKLNEPKQELLKRYARIHGFSVPEAAEKLLGSALEIATSAHQQVIL